MREENITIAIISAALPEDTMLISRQSPGIKHVIATVRVCSGVNEIWPQKTDGQNSKDGYSDEYSSIILNKSQYAGEG
jgi:hypothetical protein